MRKLDAVAIGVAMGLALGLPIALTLPPPSPTQAAEPVICRLEEPQWSVIRGAIRTMLNAQTHSNSSPNN